MIKQNIKKARRKKKITQPLLARKTGLSVSTIQNYEAGNSTPNNEKLKLIADALGVSVESLVSGKGLDDLQPDPKQDIEPIEKAFSELERIEDRPKRIISSAALASSAAFTTMINPVVGVLAFYGSYAAQAILNTDLKSKSKKELLDLFVEGYTDCNSDIHNCRTKLQSLAERTGRVSLDYQGAEIEEMHRILIALIIMYQDYLFSIMDKSVLYRRCVNALSHKDMDTLKKYIDSIKRYEDEERKIESKIKRQEELLSKREEELMLL